MTERSVKLRVWDWTLRAFHWSIVVLVLAMWWTAEQGFMQWHKWLGLVFVGLLVYRLVWGIVGPRTAQLAALLAPPGRIFRYVKSLTRSPYQPTLGHNPLGALSVLALLGLLVLQVGSGLFAVDVDGLFSGWLGRFVSFDTGRALSDLHENVFNILVGFIVLHLIAILAYRLVLKADLLGPMITGDRSVPESSDEDPQIAAQPLRVLVAALVATVFCWLIYAFGG